ncbi:VOC family protein [Kribbella sp. VKM Ac-2566]|uniref:VOC family protein n=1 Tax=Kribbella sp. VKM Ac-2566 TaxID=2512218 RepID=UPI0027299B83|nr:VOC family protein [Kribbella sp. VKM Ac-2566]
MVIERLDCLVLTVADLEATVRFYRDVLGMRYKPSGEGRSALRLVIRSNLHEVSRTFEPKAAAPTAARSSASSRTLAAGWRRSTPVGTCTGLPAPNTLPSLRRGAASASTDTWRTERVAGTQQRCWPQLAPRAICKCV